MTPAELNPGLILILGALLIPLWPGKLKVMWMVALPVVAFLHAYGLDEGLHGKFDVMGLELTTLRLDGLSRIFGYIFLLAAFLGAIYAWHVGGWVEHTAGMIYAGSAIGAVYAGDLVTLFLFWEGTAIASVFLIWAVFIICGALLVIDPFVPKHEGYTFKYEVFEIERWWGFYGIYGFIGCVFLVLAAKEMRRIIMKPERYYEELEGIDEPR